MTFLYYVLKRHQNVRNKLQTEISLVQYSVMLQLRYGYDLTEVNAL